MSSKSSCSFIDKLRQYKFFGMAIFDWVATFIFAVILGTLIYLYANSSSSIYVTILKTFVLVIVLAIIVHFTLGIPTMLNYYLGLNTLKSVTEKHKKC